MNAVPDQRPQTILPNLSAHSKGYLFCNVHSHNSAGGFVLQTLQPSIGPLPVEQTPQTNFGLVPTILVSEPRSISLLGPHTYLREQATLAWTKSLSAIQIPVSASAVKGHEIKIAKDR